MLLKSAAQLGLGWVFVRFLLPSFRQVYTRVSEPDLNDVFPYALGQLVFSHHPEVTSVLS